MTTYSFVSYTGDGVTKDFSLTFNYQDQDHIKVFVDNVDTDDVSSLYEHSFQDATTVRVTKISGGAAPDNGAVVKLERQTPISSPDVSFAQGSSIRASNLNDAVSQLLYAVQEASDDAANGIRLDDDDKFDARSKVIKNVADPVADNDAVNKGYFEGTFEPTLDAKVTAATAAQTAAETAQTAAEAAQTAAETAETNAEAAETGAVAAQTAATAAQTASETAQTAAETAQTAAEAALDELTDLYLGAKSSDPALDNDGNALQDGALYFNTTSQVFRGYDLGTTTWYDADDASASASAAAAAQTAAETAQTAAEAAQSAAETAQTGAETAETNASGSASAAASSATNAATSETNAAASASAAASSATSASSHQTNAAASATAAASSASAAATSETNAATSETNAATSETNAAASEAGAAAAAAAAVVEQSSLALFRAEHPTIQPPAKAFTFYDGVSGGDFTVTRASTANTRFNKKRLLETVAANVLRYDHDPETGEPKGVRIEPQRTQLLLHPKDLTDSAWLKNSVTITANQGVDSSGSQTLDKAVPGAQTAEEFMHFRQTVSVTGQEPYTVSCEVDSSGYTDVVIGAGGTATGTEALFDLTTGQLVGTKSHPAAPQIVGTPQIKRLGGGRFRLSMVVTATGTGASSLTVYFKSGANPTGWSYGYVFDTDGVTGANFGSFMLTYGHILSSYIDAGASQVTVDGDVIHLDPSAQDWFAGGSQEGTILLDLDPDWLWSGVGFFQLRDAASSGNGFQLLNSASVSSLEGASGSARGDATSIRISAYGSIFSTVVLSTAALGRLKIAAAWDRNNISATVNGAAVSTTALSSPLGAAMQSMAIGNVGHSSVGMAGTCRDLAYWPSKLSDADLVTLTTA